MDKNKFKFRDLSAAWEGMKKNHKALNNGAVFKPDIAPVIKKLDQVVDNYNKLLDQRKKLIELRKQLADASSLYRDESVKHQAERDKIGALDKETVRKYE